MISKPLYHFTLDDDAPLFQLASKMRILWSGAFLDGKLVIACDDDPSKQHIIHYRVDAYDCAHWGILEIICEDTIEAQKEALIEILKEIRERYIQFVTNLRDECIKQHECSIH